MRKQMLLDCRTESVAQALDFIHTTLTELGLDSRKITSTMLTAEELIVKLISEGSSTGKLHLRIWKQFGSIRLRISALGSAFPLEAAGLSLTALEDPELAPEAEMAIRSLILNAHKDEIRLKHRLGVNIADLTVKKSDQSNALRVLLALFGGVLFGLLLRLLAPGAVSGWLAVNGFGLVSSMFVNAVMMLVGPLVFFSMAACIAKFTDLTSLGRIGIKVLGCYLLTSVLALFVGYGTFLLFRPGSPALLNTAVSAAGDSALAAGGAAVSLRETVLNIVPDNFIAAFLDADMIQIIVLGMLLGASAGGLGKYSQGVQEMLDAMNELFSRAMTMVTKLLPAAIFCTMANMAITMDSSSFRSVLGIAGCVYFAAVLQMAVYGLLLLFLGRLNPFRFYRKFFPAMAAAFSLCSSNASMPMTMKTLDEQVGVSSKVYSFSIPLGSTVNMDGFCIFMVLTVLAFANALGMTFSGSMLFSLFLTVALLSLGAPGVPGSGAICLTMLLVKFHMPMELVGIAVSIYTMIDFIGTCCNVTGDAAVTTLVAADEHLLDLEVYNS